MDRKKLIYIGSLLILTVIVSVTYFSYAFWTNKDVQHAKINVVAGTLNYEVKGKGISNNAITIGGNTTKKIELTLKSLNEISSKYELYYTTTSNDIEVGYSSDTKDGITGTINEKGSKKITVFITNPTSSNITVTFGAEGGFTGNTLTRTQGKAIPSQESICENYTTHVFNFDYTGDIQEFVAPCTGTYTMETWGAQGGTHTDNDGYGGYSVGDASLTVNSINYIVVGGQGTTGNASRATVLAPGLGGYNGGGNSGKATMRTDVADTYYQSGGGGGGATHIATVSGLLKDLEEYKDTAGTNKSNEILIVSGGGGGNMVFTPGSGGGFKGVSSIGGTPGNTNGNQVGGRTQGGTQTTGYAFGQGQTAIDSIGGGWGSEGSGGGGGGYYGGTASQVTGNYSDDSGAGGSGYIGSPNLTNKAMYCYHCEESMEEDTYTISTHNSAYMQSSSSCSSGYSTDPISKCAKLGNGYARITYYGTDTTKVTYDYNYLPNDIFSEYYNTSSLIVANASIGVTANSYTDEYGLGYETTRYCETCTNSSGIYLRRIKSLSVGKKYTLIIEAKADGNYDFLLEHEQLNHPYDYSRTLSPNWQRYKITAEVNKDGGTIILYRWVSSTNRTLYIRNIQLQEGDLYTKDRNYIKGGTLSDIETPKRSGWTFAGWYTDPIGGTQVTSSTSVPNSDTTYYAHWTYITN